MGTLWTAQIGEKEERGWEGGDGVLSLSKQLLCRGPGVSLGHLA